MNTSTEILRAALEARTATEASEVQSAIERMLGGRHQCPVGDRWNNQGMLTASGASFDHKVLEGVTNMQDAVLELWAAKRFGANGSVPYSTPREAAEALSPASSSSRSFDYCQITIEAATEPPSKKKVTVVMRDAGCGIANHMISRTIFHVGARHKNGIDWLQGTFGLGGTTMYRNAEVVVLVTRRHPDMLVSGEPDLISVAIVQWECDRTTTNAFYLVDRPWDADHPNSGAVPFSVPASEYPDFEPGTHLALVGYSTQGFGRMSGDERAFDTIFNTRLFKPVMPVRFQNRLVRERVETLRGLHARLEGNPGEPGMEGQEDMPFQVGGRTYRLPVYYRVFAAPKERGERRSFVAFGHAVVITSNGQVHAHWTPQQFKYRTGLNKLESRVFIVVETDPLPLEVRAQVFTADRSDTAKVPVALQLEDQIAAFLKDLPALSDVNDALIREAITSEGKARSTIEVARKIARAVSAQGFSVDRLGGKGGGRTIPKPTPAEQLFDDPTHFEGPAHVEVAIGTTKSVFFRLNAKDGFLGADSRGSLVVDCNHPEIGADEITVGGLVAGRVRVSVSVPETDRLGEFTLTARVSDWSRNSGGIGHEFRWITEIEVVAEIVEKPTGKGGAGAKAGNAGKKAGGDLVALIWTNTDDAFHVGAVEMIPGHTLAGLRADYEELAGVDDKIPTIVLNPKFSPLKSYLAARSVEQSEEAKWGSRDRYAVGAGVALLLLDVEERRIVDSGKTPDEEAFATARRAAARGVLTVLPEYDKLAKELED